MYMYNEENNNIETSQRWIREKLHNKLNILEIML